MNEYFPVYGGSPRSGPVTRQPFEEQAGLTASGGRAGHSIVAGHVIRTFQPNPGGEPQAIDGQAAAEPHGRKRQRVDGVGPSSQVDRDVAPFGQWMAVSPSSGTTKNNEQPAEGLPLPLQEQGLAGFPLPSSLASPILHMPPQAVLPPTLPQLLVPSMLASPVMPPAFMPTLCQLLLVYMQRGHLVAHQAAGAGAGGPPTSQLRQQEKAVQEPQREVQPQQQEEEAGQRPPALAPEPRQQQKQLTEQQQQPQPTRHLQLYEQERKPAAPSHAAPAVLAVRQLQAFGIPPQMLLQAAAHLMVVGAMHPGNYQTIQSELRDAAQALLKAATHAPAPAKWGPSGADSTVTGSLVRTSAAANTGLGGTAAARLGGIKSTSASETPPKGQTASAARPMHPQSATAHVDPRVIGSLAGAADSTEAPLAAGSVGTLTGLGRGPQLVASGLHVRESARIVAEAKDADGAGCASVWVGRGGGPSAQRLGLGRRLFTAIALQLPTNAELDCVLPPLHSLSGVLYRVPGSGEVGGALWDGAVLRDLGTYSSVQDARQSVTMSIKLIAAAAAAAPQPSGPHAVRKAPAATAADSLPAPRPAGGGVKRVGDGIAASRGGNGDAGRMEAGGVAEAVRDPPQVAAAEGDVMEAAEQLLLLRTSVDDKGDQATVPPQHAVGPKPPPAEQPLGATGSHQQMSHRPQEQRRARGEEMQPPQQPQPSTLPLPLQVERPAHASGQLQSPPPQQQRSQPAPPLVKVLTSMPPPSGLQLPPDKSNSARAANTTLAFPANVSGPIALGAVNVASRQVTTAVNVPLVVSLAGGSASSADRTAGARNASASAVSSAARGLRASAASVKTPPAMAAVVAAPAAAASAAAVTLGPAAASARAPVGPPITAYGDVLTGFTTVSAPLTAMASPPSGSSARDHSHSEGASRSTAAGVAATAQQAMALPAMGSRSAATAPLLVRPAAGRTSSKRQGTAESTDNRLRTETRLRDSAPGADPPRPHAAALGNTGGSGDAPGGAGIREVPLQGPLNSSGSAAGARDNDLLALLDQETQVLLDLLQCGQLDRDTLMGLIANPGGLAALLASAPRRLQRAGGQAEDTLVAATAAAGARQLQPLQQEAPSEAASASPLILLEMPRDHSAPRKHQQSADWSLPPTLLQLYSAPQGQLQLLHKPQHQQLEPYASYQHWIEGSRPSRDRVILLDQQGRPAVALKRSDEGPCCIAPDPRVASAGRLGEARSNSDVSGRILALGQPSSSAADMGSTGPVLHGRNSSQPVRPHSRDGLLDGNIVRQHGTQDSLARSLSLGGAAKISARGGLVLSASGGDVSGGAGIGGGSVRRYVSDAIPSMSAAGRFDPLVELHGFQYQQEQQREEQQLQGVLLQTGAGGLGSSDAGAGIDDRRPLRGSVLPYMSSYSDPFHASDAGASGGYDQSTGDVVGRHSSGVSTSLPTLAASHDRTKTLRMGLGPGSGPQGEDSAGIAGSGGRSGVGAGTLFAMRGAVLPPSGIPGTDSNGSGGVHRAASAAEGEAAVAGAGEEAQVVQPDGKRRRHHVTREYAAVTNLVGLGLQEALAMIRQRGDTFL